MAVPDPIALTPSQAFEQERMARFIDETDDVETLRSIAKLLLDGWMTQKAATNWAIRQAMPAPPQAPSATPPPGSPLPGPLTPLPPPPRPRSAPTPPPRPWVLPGPVACGRHAPDFSLVTAPGMSGQSPCKHWALSTESAVENGQAG